MSVRVGFLAAIALAACASGSDAVDAGRADAGPDGADPEDAAVDAPDDDGSPPPDATDAPPVDATDARPPDAPTDGPPPVVASLLLSEIVLAPNGAELVEIVNPTGATVDLSRYHLSDAPSYWRLPAGVMAVGADTTDFIARFPAGAMIAPGAVVTVALDTPASFTAQYPTLTPTYSVAGGTMTLLTAGTAPTLTNAGEPVALFFWDGATDKVTDVDLMIAGTPSAANAFVTKSGVAVDGPDPDATPTAYATDANALPSQTAPASLRSTKRLALESAIVETQTGGGNGVAGHDETSEQTNVTWDSAAYTAPTPGTVPAALQP